MCNSCDANTGPFVQIGDDVLRKKSLTVADAEFNTDEGFPYIGPLDKGNINMLIKRIRSISKGIIRVSEVLKALENVIKEKNISKLFLDKKILLRYVHTFNNDVRTNAVKSMTANYIQILHAFALKDSKNENNYV